MYAVSSGYLDAIRGKIRTDRITGSITLSDGTTITIDDSVLVKDTLKLTRELCRGKYRIGTFNLGCLRFGFFIDNAIGIDLTGAYTQLYYGLLVNGSYENVPLGKFLIDPVLSVRRKNILSIVAYDEGVKFDIPPSSTLRQTEDTPDVLIAAACAECGVSTDITAQTIAAFPNSSLTVCAGERQIQTCRDLIMWCAALMCCYAAVDRDSKLVLIPAKYSVDPNDQTVIITDRTIREDERRNITVTDTRAYIKYLAAYAGDDVANYTSSYVSPDDQASPAGYVLEKNPLLAGLTAAQCNTANIAWLGYIDAFKQRGVSAEIFGDPAIDTGDTIAFRGGDVDQRSSIIGVVTGIEWRYRGCQDIECLAADCCGSLVGQGGSYTSSEVRKQSSKRIDGVQTAGSGGVGEFTNDEQNSERFNDYTNNSSTGQFNHVEGRNNVANGGSASSRSVLHVEGENNTVSGYCVHCEGQHNTVTNANKTFVSGDNHTINGASQSAVLGGSGSTISGTDNIVGGSSHTVPGNGNAVFGNYNRLSSTYYNFVSGQSNEVSGWWNLVSGTSNDVSDNGSAVSGFENEITSGGCVVGGQRNKALARGAVFGWENTNSGTNSLVTGDNNTNSASEAIMCGNYGVNQFYRIAVGGGSNGSPALVFYVDPNGTTYAAGGYTSPAADYAEYFEWADGNPDYEDRRGMLVQLIGDKIAPAHGDDILGIISVCPSVVGNAYGEHWRGKYKRDIFGAYILDEDGEKQTSEDYDKGREYIPRSQRQEWAAVGLLGQLVIRDNGKCQPGGYVSARSGIGVPTFTETNVRCLKRIDETHCIVLIK